MQQQQSTTEKTEAVNEAAQKKPNLFRAAVLLTVSASMLIFTVIVLRGMGFHHMIAGMFIGDGVVRHGVIREDGQITKIPEGEVKYRMNRNIVFDNAWVRGSIMLENPEVSENELEFSFYLPSNRSKAIYTSPRLKPGECLLNDKLDEHPRKGSYACVCIVKAYDSEGNYTGQYTDSVRLTIVDY